MAVNFSEKQNKQKYLVIVLIAVIFIAIFVMRDSIIGFFTPVASITEVFLPQEIEINFEILKNSVLVNLQMPEPEKAFSGQAGRVNPFLPY